MRALILILLLSADLAAQIRPPTQSIKKRHGETVEVKWDFSTEASWTLPLLYFSIKESPSLTQAPIEFKQVPKTERAASFVALFHPDNPRSVYYVISAVYEGNNESISANTIEVDRVGPPPPNSR